MLAAALAGNSLQLPASTVQATEMQLNNGDSEKAAVDHDILSDSIVEEEQANEEETDNEEADERADAAHDSTERLEDSAKAEFLHIGQVRNTEPFLYLDNTFELYDTGEIYDLPIDLTTAVKIRLFADCSNIDIINAKDESAFTWSILRGEAGMISGTANLVDEEDDWTDFETVSSSPFFTAEEDEDEDSVFYRTLVITAATDADGDTVVDGSYNYYIRATLRYLQGESEHTAITTLPVILQRSVPDEDTGIDGKMKGSEDAETEEDSTVSAETEEMEDGANDVVDEDALIGVELYGMEDGEIGAKGEDDSALSVFDDEEIDSEESIEDQIKKLNITKLTLNKSSVTMNPGDTLELSATIAPEGLGKRVEWSIQSNDDSGVVEFVTEAVNEEAAGEKDIATTVKIKALSEGRAEITAECDGKKAVVTVEVVLTDADKNEDRPTDRDGESIEEISNEIWVAGFERESDDLTYTGAKLIQNLRVYHKGALLTEKTDYTLTYKNNVNAATYDSSKAPSVTIKMKGQYSGSRTLYFTIQPRNIDGDGTMGYEQVIQYAKTLKIPAPTLSYNSKKLISNKDFVCDYSSLPENYTKGDSYEDGVVYEYTVNGKGNYTGSCTMRLAVIRDKNLNLGSATVTLDKKQYEYHGGEEGLSKEDVGITVKFGKTVVDENYYEYDVQGKSVGTGYVEIYPSNVGREAGYRGTKKVNIKVVGDRKIKDAILGDEWQPSIIFSQKRLNEDGGIIQAKEGVLVYHSEDEPLKEGEDYTVKYSAHKKVGTATVTFTGKGRYTGSFKKTYKIVANTDLDVNWHDMEKWEEYDEKERPVAAYVKGGAIPRFDVMENPPESEEEGREPLILSGKTDYTVKYKNNTKLGIMTCMVTGKGNYKGYSITTEIKVLPSDISLGTITASDKQYSTKANAWKSAVTIKDVNGKKLTAGTDYDKALVYRYKGMEEGVPQPGTYVYVIAVGIKNYEGSSITGSYRIYEKNISNLTIAIDAQEYTGREVELTSDDIHVYANKTDAKKGIEIQNKESCYQIVLYSNNIKAGTGKVILRGIGDYGGTKTYSFKITKKSYLTSIVLDETSFTLSIGMSRQLTATVAPDDVWNQTVIWKSSNSKIATVEGGLVTATQKSGKVTITATSRETGKKATCKVNVAVIPVTSFTLKETRIEGDEGTTHQLIAEDIEPIGATYSTIEWESNNPEIASVDATGTVSLNQAGMTVIKAYANKRQFVAKCLVFVNSSPDGSEPGGSYHTPQEYRTDLDEDDDTGAINRAIDALGRDGTLYIPAGTYMIDAVKGIQIESDNSNIKIIMSPNAVLKAIGNSDEKYMMIHVTGAGNVTISGGRIVGERYEHKGKSGEYGHGIGVYGGKNIKIIDVDISECWGDGIYLGSHNENAPEAGCDEITITGCTVHDNRRNNLSIVCADNVTVDGCAFNNANGTSPEYGIDIETNVERDPCEHIKITNSTFDGNRQGSIGIVTAANDIRIEKCILNDPFINYAGKNVVISDSEINAEADARIGVILESGSKINDGTSADDVLIAEFSAAECPYPFDAANPSEYDQCPYTFGQYGADNISCNMVEDTDSPSGKALCLKRESQGTKEAGYYLNIKELTLNGSAALEKNATYRFEYVVKGSGQWGIKTDQTGWYPCIPMSDKYSTGIVTYKAGSANSCKLYLYAIDIDNGMELRIDSIKIYKVQ